MLVSGQLEPEQIELLAAMTDHLILQSHASFALAWRPDTGCKFCLGAQHSRFCTTPDQSSQPGIQSVQAPAVLTQAL